MAELKLEYGGILEAAKQANKVANECVDYAERITSKINNKLNGLERGATAETALAARYASKKSQELNKKAEKYEAYGTKLKNFVEDDCGAQKVDENVAKTLSDSYKGYIDEHNIKVNPLVEAFVTLSVWGGNATGFGKVLKQLYDFKKGVDHVIKEKLEYWYRCKGGKNVIKIGAAILGAVAAVAAVVVAWPVMVAAISAGAVWASIVAVASVVGGVIAAVNSVVNVIAETHALGKQVTNNPAEALMSSNIDSLSDASRGIVFESKIMNKLSMKFASAWDNVEFVCNVIAFADLAKNGISFVKGLKNKGGFKKNFLDKFKKDGKWDKKNTWKNLTEFANDATENQTLKKFDDAIKLDFKKSKTTGAKFYNFFREVNDSKEFKVIKNTCDYAETYGDSGLKGVAKKAVKDTSYKQIDIADKAVDIGMYVVEKIVG